jgi:hypothetical protein
MSTERPEEKRIQAHRDVHDIAGRYAGAMVTAESWVARGLYWVLATISVSIAVLGLAAQIAGQQDHGWQDIAIGSAIILAIATVVYCFGWGWRWLWTGRTDNLFGRKKYSSGRLESARRKVAVVMAIWP